MGCVLCRCLVSSVELMIGFRNVAQRDRTSSGNFSLCVFFAKQLINAIRFNLAESDALSPVQADVKIQRTMCQSPNADAVDARRCDAVDCRDVYSTRGF